MMFLCAQVFWGRICDVRDRFWAALWWTRFRLYVNEIHLAHALETHGEDSMLVRTITERHRRLMKGLRYWRTSDPLVLQVLENCEDEGLPIADLQLLSLNRDLRMTQEGVVIRCGWGYVALAYMAGGFTLFHWFVFTTLVLTAPLELTEKVLGLLAVSGFYWFVWSGLALYTTRPLAAIMRSGGAIEAIAMRSRRSTAQIVVLSRA
jgi:hypothetical protein